MATLDTKLEHWPTNNLPLDKFNKLLTNKSNSSSLKSASSTSSSATVAVPSSTSLSTMSTSSKRDSLGSSSNASSSSVTLNNLNNNSSSSSNSSNNSNSGSNINGSDYHHHQQSQQKHQKMLEHMTANLILSDTASENSDGSVTCSYCTISFLDKNELRQHCQTETHQNVIMSDEGRDWKWRPPPRGYTADSYSLCESCSESQLCHYGNQCVEAHGLDELKEWKERFEYRKMRLQRACEKELYGKSYTEELLEKWVSATSPDKVMREKIDNIEETCSNELVTTISSKVSKREWAFVLKTQRHLRAVALLQDSHRHYFTIKSIVPDSVKAVNKKSSASSSTAAATAKKEPGEIELKSDQEWVATNYDWSFRPTHDSPTLEHRIKIAFSTDIYGTFRQSVCFDFGADPVLVKHICVDVVPVGEAEKIQEIKKDIISSSAQRWDDTNSALVKFETTIGSHLKTEAYLNDLKREKDLLDRYPCPRAATFTLTQSTILDKRLTKNNYRSRIHELLYVEEIARYEQIARYNLSTKLRVASNYTLTPSGMATSTAKYSHSGELFALMSLGKDVSEDTSAGRLILSNCMSVYLSANVPAGETDAKKREVYEATIEDKGKNMIYLKLSAKCVQGLNLKADMDFQCDIQFQLNRLSYCEWHNAIDQIADFRIIFPDTYIEPNIPWTPKKQWSDACDPKLNTKQKEAINAITTPTNCQLPPILLIGPFGTGKTYTLAQAIKNLLSQPDAKILICTHSNSAADLYIKEYLHPWVEKGLTEATPLRVYYHKRWVATVNSVVQKYCIIDGNGNFRRPSIDDILKHRIVVVTLNISMELALLGLPKGYFTHIFLDEAAQAMECEAIMPLALANENTRIVLAGDHMQMSPELFSNFAKERKLHISLLERLYDHYPSNFPCKILLCENYRAHEAIIKFTSELFYEQKLIASGKQPRHEKFYPLTFFTTRGEDVQDENSTAFYNNSEVYEVVERVCELKKKWPSSWGKINDQSIGIMTPYADQVFRIRSELRKRRMGGISVERVLNVQGKQFRAIFLSTVRTRRTCPLNNNSGNSVDDSDYGFLSNSKLLNTAITRAQSLVAVVGDPVALCSIGRCRKVWERFIEICHQNKSLFGLTWSYLRSQLDGVELKRSYVLNPLAPEFIPRSLQPESYLRQQAITAAASVSQQVMQVAAQQSMNQIPQNFANHPYGMMGQNAVGGPQILQKSVQPPIPHTSPMQMRPIGHPPQPYNMPGPPPPPSAQAPTNQQQFSPYIMWPQQQQQPQQQQSSQLIRPNYPLHAQPNVPPPHQHQMSGNAGVGLWGPPPQNNPWGVLPKTAVNPNVNPNMRPPAQLPPLQNQPMNIPMNNLSMRPPGAIQPPPPPPLQQQPPHQMQAMRNPQELAHLNKFVYPNQNPIMINQMNLRNQLHNGPASPGDISRASAATSTANMHLPNMNNFSAHPYLTPLAQQNLYPKDKEVQFLNNVHNIPVNMNSGPLHPPAPPPPPPPNAQPFPDYSVLLPPNMNFYDIALETKDFQYKWYLHLLENQGQEAANKFTDILRQVMAAASTITSKNLMVPSQQANVQQQTQLPPQLTAAGNNGPLRQVPPQPQLAQLTAMSASALGGGNSTAASGNLDGNINFNQQIDMVFNSLMSGSEMSPPMLRDLLGMVSSTANNGNGGNGGNVKELLPHPVPTTQPLHQQHTAFPSSQLLNTTQMISGANSDRVESVPLYRRHAMGNGSFGSPPSSNHASSGSPDLISDTLNNSSFMESLFSSGDLNPYTSVNSIQKLFNNYDMKTSTNECNDLLMRNPSQHNSLQHFAQQQSQHSHMQQQHHPSQSSGNSNHATYAAVLSQGPNLAPHHHHHQLTQQQQQQQQQQSLHPHQQQSINSHLHLSTSSNSSTMPNVVMSSGSHAHLPSSLNTSSSSSSTAGGGNNQLSGHQTSHSDGCDPFAAIRELGQRSNGFYNYFQ